MYFSPVTTTPAPGCYLVRSRTASGTTNSRDFPKKSTLCTTGKRLNVGIRLTGLRLMLCCFQWSTVHRPFVQLCVMLPPSSFHCTCCLCFSLLISFPRLPSSPVVSTVVFAWQCWHHIFSTCIQAGSILYLSADAAVFFQYFTEISWEKNVTFKNRPLQFCQHYQTINKRTITQPVQESNS